MAITPIIHTRARRMATMGRNGSRAVCSLAQGRGIAAITVRAGATDRAGVTDLAMVTMDAVDTAAAAATTGPDPTEAAELVMAGATGTPQWAAVASMVEADAGKRPK